MTKIFAVLVSSLLLAGCAHQVATATADPCVAFRPMYWSSKDTRASLDQMDSHNRVWKKLCAK